MTAVLKHELKSYFRSMTAYVFGAGLLLAVGLGAMLYNIEAAVSNFEFALSYFSIIFVVIVPILTMRVIAEERKQKIDHDEMPPFDHVSQIQFAGTEAYGIAYQENSADSYSVDDVYFTQRGGKNLSLDTSKVKSYLRSITNLNPVNYMSYNVTDEALQTYGLDAPELTITVDYTAEGKDGEETAATFVLYVSPDPEDVKAAGEAEDDDQEADISAYIRVGNSQIAYKAAASNHKKLAAASYNDLRHPEVIWADFSDVQEINISLEGNSYTLTSEKDGEERAWTYQKKDELEIADLQSALGTLTADEFTDERPA